MFLNHACAKSVSATAGSMSGEVPFLWQRRLTVMYRSIMRAIKAAFDAAGSVKHNVPGDMSLTGLLSMDIDKLSGFGAPTHAPDLVLWLAVVCGMQQYSGIPLHSYVLLDKIDATSLGERKP